MTSEDRQNQNDCCGQHLSAGHRRGYKGDKPAQGRDERDVSLRRWTQRKTDAVQTSWIACTFAHRIFDMAWGDWAEISVMSFEMALRFEFERLQIDD
jgi:hypothetical protein